MGQPNKIIALGLSLTLLSLPWSPFGTSLGMGLIALSCIISAIKRNTDNPDNKVLPLSLEGLFLMSAVGILFSDNITEGINATIIKLPLFIVPLALYYVKWDKSLIISLAKIFLTSTFFAAIFTTFYGYFFSAGEFSPFISHIRMGILLALGTGILIHEKKWTGAVVYGLVTLVSIWHTQSVTGLAMLALVCIYFLATTKTLIGAFAFCAIISAGALYSLLPTPFEGELESTTPWGSQYVHYPERHLEENGNKVFINLAVDEMRPEWDKRSSIPFDSLDARGHNIESTLIRYLTSLGLHKNGEVVRNLSAKDISNIESGHTSIRMSSHSGLSLRLDDLKFEVGNYLDGGDPNGNSVTMRLETFKAGLHVLKTGGIETLLFGVGTGDLPGALKSAYVESGSRLNEKYWMRCHNQYLAWWVGLGIFSLALFIVALISSWKSSGSLGKLFVLVVAISCLAEDTLETQAGVTFAVIAISLLPFYDKTSNS